MRIVSWNIRAGGGKRAAGILAQLLEWQPEIIGLSEYTWYSHRNNGFRLDHAFCSPELVPAIVGLQHAWGRDSEQPNRRDALSDHAAVIIEFATDKI